jgi:hypothetical protein
VLRTQAGRFARPVDLLVDLALDGRPLGIQLRARGRRADVAPELLGQAPPELLPERALPLPPPRRARHHELAHPRPLLGLGQHGRQGRVLDLWDGKILGVPNWRSAGDASCMLDLLLVTLAALRAACWSRGDLVLENLLLRHQLAVLTRPTRRRRARFRGLDKALWVLIRRVRRDWRRHLVVVTPDAVVRWHSVGWRLGTVT